MRSPILALLLGAAGTGLSGQATVLAPDEPCAGRSDAAIATFRDPRLETAVRMSLGLPGDARLTCAQLARVTQVEARGRGIETLSGIQNLTGLRRLNVWENSIDDVVPLRDLTTLTYLDLGVNEIRDLAPLSGLTRLDTLYLNGNHLEDVTPLAPLTGLRLLFIHANAIRDLSPLAGLTRLTDLNVTYNSISDISALSGMTELETLRVYNNPLTDIGAMRGLTELHELHVHDLPELTDLRPLIDNPGLGPGDRVIVYNTGASCADVASLRAKGVPVGTDCLGQNLLQVLPGLAVGLLTLTAVGILTRRWLERRRRPTGTANDETP